MAGAEYGTLDGLPHSQWIHVYYIWVGYIRGNIEMKELLFSAHIQTGLSSKQRNIQIYCNIYTLFLQSVQHFYQSVIQDL